MGSVEKPEEITVRSALGRYLSPGLVDKIMKADPADTSYLRTEMTHFQFVLVHVKEDEPEETTKTIAKVVETTCANGGTIGNMACSLIVLYLGLPYPKHDSPEARQNLVAALIREGGDRIRVVHGQCDGLAGLFGSQKRMNYGALIPNFSGALKTLLSVELGTAVEITC